MELLQTLPEEANYTALAEHQSHTPASFYSGPAVLHYVSRGASLAARPSDLRAISALAKLTGTESALGADEVADAAESDVHVAGLDVWVASDKLVLARPSTALALAIPYRTIALHAVSAAGLYLQLSTSAADHEEDDDDAGPIEITLTPAASNGAADGARPVDALFKALSDCADLHPDPQEDGDEEDEGGAAMPSFGLRDDALENGTDAALYQITAPATAAGHQPGLPPPVPGSGGWITAENMHEFFDEEGNWKGDGAPSGLLGPGAGTVRERDAEDGEEMDSEQPGDSEDTKWQRTG